MDWLQGFGPVLLRVFADADLARVTLAWELLCGLAAFSENQRVVRVGRDLKILVPASIRDTFC